MAFEKRCFCGIFQKYNVNVFPLGKKAGHPTICLSVCLAITKLDQTTSEKLHVLIIQTAHE